MVPERVVCQAAGVPRARVGGGAVRGAVAERHVARLVHGDGAHPAVDPVGHAGGVGALLVDHRRAVRARGSPTTGYRRCWPQPPPTGWSPATRGRRSCGRRDGTSAAGGRTRMSILLAVPGCGMQSRPSRTGNCVSYGGDGDRVGQDEGRVRRGREVGVELPQRQRVLGRAVLAAVVHRAHEVVRRIRRRRNHPVQVARQQAVADVVRRRPPRRVTRNEITVGDGLPATSLGAVDRVGADPCERPVELAGADVQRVRPHPVLRVVRQVGGRC